MDNKIGDRKLIIIHNPYKYYYILETMKKKQLLYCDHKYHFTKNDKHLRYLPFLVLNMNLCAS